MVFGEGESIKIFSLKPFFLSIIFLLSSCNAEEIKPGYMPGAVILIEKQINSIVGRNIGLVTNHTGRLSDGTHLADKLHKLEGVNLVALFGPEHGIRGDADAGEKVKSSVDEKTGVKIFSLYGSDFKPTPEMLKGVDLLIYDIQDVGARFYTYISTLYYLLEAAAENNIEVIILDRINPLSGNYISGPVLEKEFKSFVGIAEIPIAHGMTTGELAMLFSGEFLGEKGKKLKLNVIKAEGISREMFFDCTGNEWVATSPNIPKFESALVYPGICLFEGVNISEGRGTYNPFLTIGAPFIDGNDLAQEIKKYNLSGFEVKPIKFTPKSIKGMSSEPKLKGKECGGLEIAILSTSDFDPVVTGIALIKAINTLYPKDLKFNDKWFDKLSGTSTLRKQILAGDSIEKIVSSWQPKLSAFKELRKKYLLY